MMKEWISGRQFLSLLLVFAFTFALLGCAQSAEAASAAGAAEQKTGAPGFFLTAEYTYFLTSVHRVSSSYRCI